MGRMKRVADYGGPKHEIPNPKLVHKGIRCTRFVIV